MKDRAKLTVGIGTILMSILIFAFVAAPKSCRGGNEAYFFAGIISFLALFLSPFVLRAGRTLRIRAALGMAFASIGVLVWFGGLFAADFRIICKLF